MAEPARDLIPYFTVCIEETVNVQSCGCGCSFNVFFIIEIYCRSIWLHNYGVQNQVVYSLHTSEHAYKAQTIMIHTAMQSNFIILH